MNVYPADRSSRVVCGLLELWVRIPQEAWMSLCWRLSRPLMLGSNTDQKKRGNVSHISFGSLVQPRRPVTLRYSANWLDFARIFQFITHFTFLQTLLLSLFIPNVIFLHFVDVSVCPAGPSKLFCCVNCKERWWGQQESRNVCAVVQNYTASYARRKVHSCYNDNLKFHALITSCITRVFVCLFVRK